MRGTTETSNAINRAVGLTGGNLMSQKRISWLALMVAVALMVPTAVGAQIAEPNFFPQPQEATADAGLVAPRLAGTLTEPAAYLLPARIAAIDEIEALAAHNREGRLPVRNGFTRPLATTIQFSMMGTDLDSKKGVTLQRRSGELIWATHVRVEDANRIRLLLEDVQLPAGSHFWIYGAAEIPRHFDLSLLGPDNELWTPSVERGTAYLEVVIPESESADAPYGFTIRRVAEIVELGPQGEPLEGSSPFGTRTTCLADATCVQPSHLEVADSYRRAVARLQFMKGGQSALCSGGLLNDTVSSGTPLLLTANHCFSTQASASSLEAFWDYRSSTCGGPPPSLGSVPRSVGGSLIATAQATDVTLVKLGSVPAGRVYLGWNASSGAVSEGTVLHRISHPLGYHQAYSRALVTSGTATCGFARPMFVHSFPEIGGTYGGSSGAPVILSSGHVIGQLYGGCGPNAQDGCDYRNREVDGALSQSWPILAPYLNPPPSGDTSPCVRGAETACLLNNRFEVKVTWTRVDGTGTGKVMSFGGQRAETNLSVFLWFFESTNFEMGIKMVNACVPPFNRFWAFVSGLTNQGFDVVIRDTQTGNLWTYNNPLGTLPQTVGDTQAFPCS